MLKKLIFPVYILLGVFILLEAGVRIWGYSDDKIYDPIYTTFSKSEDIPYVHKPNLKNARARGLVTFNTDSLGLRSRVTGTVHPSKGEKEYRIAIAGDSVTFGQGVKRTEDTFCSVVEDILNRKQEKMKVSVFNYGVAAYSVKEMVASLKHRMLLVKPDLVVMAVISDDLDLSRTPIVDKWGYTASNENTGLLGRDSYVKLLLRKVHLIYPLRDIFSHWSRNYPGIKKSDPAPDLKGSIEKKGQAPSNASYEYFKRFKVYAEEADLEYIIILLPTAKTRFGDLGEYLKRNDITFVDLSWIRHEFRGGRFLASKYDAHPSSAVHRRIGDVLADDIMSEYLH